MSIQHQILGLPGRDNALLATVDTGKSITRILFDCGDCINQLSVKQIHEIDHLMFSHQHMDHIAGFDHFFRCNYSRTNRPNHIWGPKGTAGIIQHRMQGFQWNLCEHMQVSWWVHEFNGNQIQSYRFELNEGFSICHEDNSTLYSGESVPQLLDHKDFQVEAFVMEHHGPSLAFCLRETEKTNIDLKKMQSLGLNPGPWINQLKATGGSTGIDRIEIDGACHNIDLLREQLLRSSQGESIAYLTDFLLTANNIEAVAHHFGGLDILVCEAQYAAADFQLAEKNHHMTTDLVGLLAKSAKPKQLILFHLSDRYKPEQWLQQLEEVREHYPSTHFPPHWSLSD